MKKVLIYSCLLVTSIAAPNFVVAAEESAALADQKAKISYAIGLNIGNNLKRNGYDIDLNVLTGAIKDVMAGNPPKLTEQDCREILNAAQKELAAKRDEERKKTAEKNRQLGEAFLAKNKEKEGVKTLQVTLPEGKTAEMQYKVLTEGSGNIPKSNDVVTVNYRGTLIDGKEFDSSAKRG